MKAYAAIPELLTSRPRWINWRYEQRNPDPAVKPTKVPVDPKTGKLASVDDPSTWGTFADVCANMERGLPVHGIGFVLGDGIAGVDLDDPKGNTDTLALYGRITQQFQTYAEVSPSGLGLHLIFTHSDGATGGRRRGGVELYYTDRYLTFTGNVWNGQNEVRDCTAYGEILFNELGGGKLRGTDVDEPQTEEDSVIINRAANAANGEDFRRLWAGQWLTHPSQSEADQHMMNIIGFYTNNRAQAKRIFCMTELAKTLNRKAKPAYYLDLTVGRAFDQKIATADLKQVRIELADVLAKPAPTAAAPVSGKPNRLDPPPWPGGLLGEIASFVYAQAPHPVHDIAIVAAIGLMAGICGRSYNVNGTGLNQYLMLVAPTGRGKEAINSGISKLIQAVKGQANGSPADTALVPAADTFFGPEHISSQPALMKHLIEHPSFVSVVGEFGLYLKRISSERASANDVDLKKVYLSLYGKSGAGQSQRATIYSDKQKNTTAIQSPAVTLLGETSPTRFYELLNEDMIEEGLLPRFLVWEYDGDRTPLNPHAYAVQPDAGLVQRLRTLVVTSLDKNHQNMPINVALDQAAQAMTDEFEEFTRHKINELGSSPLAQLWNRANLKMLRLAAIGAVGMNPVAPVITSDIMAWAKTIVVRDVQAMFRKFDMGEVGDTREQKRMQLVVRLAREFLTDKSVGEKYKTKPAYHTAHIVPLAYLSKRTGGNNAFKSYPNRTAHTVLLDTVKTLVDIGSLIECAPAMLSSSVGSSQRAFMLDPALLHSE